MTYDAEIRCKQKQLESFLVRTGLVAPEAIRPPVPAPRRFGLRNKIRFSIENSSDGQLQMGYRDPKTRRILPASCQCKLARKNITDAVAAVTPEIVASAGKNLTFRWTLRDGVRFFGEHDTRARAEILTEQLGNFGRFYVPAGSFFQTNEVVTGSLVERVVELVRAQPVSELVELYCGVGLFSIVCAAASKSLFCSGIELDPDAVSCAQKNAALHAPDIQKRCRFSLGNAEKNPQLVHAGVAPENTLLLVDPPRLGLPAPLCDRIASSNLRAVLYISCAPDTLQRDLARICANGRYHVVETGLFDMFPGTAHFESLTLLEANPE